MRLFRKLFNKYVLALTSLMLLVLASTGLLNLCTVKTTDASMISFDKETTISITNVSFKSFSSQSSYPYTVSGYTNKGNKTASMKTGAINISDDTYSKNYEKYGLDEYKNPKGTGSDDYVLMINTEESSNYTYVSSEFTLKANGYYYVTVSAMTIGDSVASVSLLQNDAIFDGCKIDNISTNSTWRNYTFLITTSSYEDIKLKFAMQIGGTNTQSKGCVLFDELHAGQISVEEYNDCLNAFDSSTFVERSYNGKNAYKEYNFDNIIMDYVTNGPTNQIDGNYFDKSESGLGDKTAEVHNGAMYLTADDSNVEYFGQEEVLAPNSTYRFSINVKVDTSLTKGSAFVKLNEILDEDEDRYDDFMDSTVESLTAKSSNLTISSATSNSLTDGYVEYVIYIKTDARENTKVQFSFGLGTSSSTATGSASFKNFKIERVPYSAYSSASTGSTIGKIDISERETTPSGEYENYSFNKMKSESFDGVPYPAEPTSWTKSSSGTGYQLSGVVNLDYFNNFMAKYSAQINQVTAPSTIISSTNKNVLMIYNREQESQSYTSAIKNLMANKYYKITTFVNTKLNSFDDYGVTIVAKTGSSSGYTTLAQVQDIKTNGEWQKVEIYIHTPNNSVDVSLELALGYGNKLSSGYAFFDNILVEEVDSKDAFSSRFGEYVVAGTVDIDLTDSLQSLTTGQRYNAPLLYKGENATNYNVNVGIVNLDSDLTGCGVEQAYHESLSSLVGDNRKVLAISSALVEDVYYKYTSVLSYNFESGKYYKLSFEVFTNKIAQASDREEDKKYDGETLAQGATVQLTGLENATFKYINSNNQWTKYEFYIGVNETCTSNIVFALGNDYVGSAGNVFFGNINLAEIEVEEFDAQSTSDRVLKVDTVIEEEEDEEEETADENAGNGFSWAYIPTILTFVAIVIAVIGIFIRRNVKFKKRGKVGKINYDRDNTVMKSKYRRLAGIERDKEVRELTKECEELIALRSEYEEKYKDAISRLRSAKIANRDGSKRHEITAIEREVKHISKEVARYGVQVNNYENEIEFMQTEAYLMDLEKRMMREDSSVRTRERKESLLPEEKRNEILAKREAKQARLEAKAQAKEQKLAEKQADLEAERKEIEAQLKEAKEKDEQFAKEQELKRIKAEEDKLAKERAKAEKELAKEKAKLEQETEQELEQLAQEEQNLESETVEETPVETSEETAEQTAETEAETADVEAQESTTEVQPENVESQDSDTNKDKQ